MGALDYFSDVFGSKKKSKKIKEIKTVELKVRMDCDGCERKVRKALSSMSGVQSVEVDRKLQKVTVTGLVEANKVVKKVKATGKRAEMWPYVPYNLVSNPYSPLDMSEKRASAPKHPPPTPCWKSTLQLIQTHVSLCK